MFTDKHGVEKHIPPVGQVQINGKNMAQTDCFGDHQLKCLVDDILAKSALIAN